jgi:hypothetical protein
VQGSAVWLSRTRDASRAFQFSSVRQQLRSVTKPAAPAQRLAVRRRRPVEHDHDVQVRGGRPARGQHPVANERRDRIREPLGDQSARIVDWIHAAIVAGGGSGAQPAFRWL